MAFSSIIVLLHPRRPATIVWFVIAIVVNAIKREARRLFAHVRKEIFKAVAPTVANLDAATAVIFKLFNPWIVASRFHVGPSAECGTVSKSVGNTLFPSSFPLKAAARLRVTATQITCTDGYFNSASTAALPVNDDNTSRSAIAMGNTKNGQTTVLLACDIVEFGHRAAPIGSKSSGGQTLPGLAVALSL